MAAPDQPRDGNHRFRPSPERQARIQRALDLFDQSRSYREICREIGVDVHTAYDDVQQGLAERRAVPNPGAKAREEAKLDQLDQLLDRQLMTALGDDGSIDVDALSKLVDRKLRVGERRAKLKGYDAPLRARIGELSDEDLDDMIDRHEAEVAGEHDGDGPADDEAGEAPPAA